MSFGYLLQVTQNTQASSDDGGLAFTTICGCILLPLWFLAIWYWHRYYYVRHGTLAGIMGAAAAFFFYGLAVMAMILNTIVHTIGNWRDVTGQCPRCGKRKLIAQGPNQTPHEIQPRCPHCKQEVFQPAFLTQDEWRKSGF